MLDVLEVFDFGIGNDIERFWIWILLVVSRPFKIMSCKVSCFSMNSFKSTQTFVGGCIE